MLLKTLKTLKKIFLNSFLFNLSIRNRLLLYSLALVLLPTSIILITIYNNSTSIITSRINSSVEKNLNMAESGIIQKFDGINNISNFIYLNSEFVDLLSSNHPKDMTGIINEMTFLDKMLDSFYISGINGNTLIPTIYMRNRPEYIQYNFTSKVSDLDLIETEDWYKNISTNKSSYSIVGLSKAATPSGTVKTIKYAKRLFGLNNPNIPYNALLTIDINVQDFNNILNELKPSEHSIFYIVDSECTIVMSSDASLIGKSMTGDKSIGKIAGKADGLYSSYIEQINHIDMLVSYKKIESLGWVMVSFSPLNELYGELICFKRVMYTIFIICIALVFLLSMLLSESISHPIRKLVKSMSAVKDGNLDITIEYKRNDEFSSLINAYKKMIQDIKELISKLYISEVNKKEAELKALQAQINPHFLYNTLDSINWLALAHGMDDISTMVTSLSDFFRYSLNDGNDIITLGDECKQVESYLAIQKLSFKNKFDYIIDFHPETLVCLTVKFILQPIVENSIKHGFEKMQEDGILSISAKKNDDVVEIKICDNGTGADIAVLNRIVEGKDRSSKAFAVKNVNERIRQYFGKEFGVRYYKNDASGVAAIIKIPAITTMEGFNVKNDYS